ncbi:MAG: 3-phosphoshikimate 1-carboxyvinyltransferase [Bacteroidales bacterium]|jgi:3-phosphoshikimate 1-carboxyvinyltransferase|nr:3-phosphoshikimate 1-carboxyvinyltransferase [Bacteroidales bacterium]
MILPRCSSNFSAEIRLPASKSLSNRWLILNACADSKIQLSNLSNAADTVLLQDLLNIISQPVSSSKLTEINCRNAGTVLRFLTAYLSVMPGKWLITGDDRLSVRPIADLVDALKQLGADISYTHQSERLPLLIQGKSEFSGSVVKLNMDKSSQFASALMLMISKFPNGLQIDFNSNIISQPYLEMTAGILEQCGIEVVRSEKNISLKGTLSYPPEVIMESDWTAASYFYAFVALSENGTIAFENLHKQSLQGDSILSAWFERFGVETIFTPTHVILKKVSKLSLHTLELDFTHHPDLAQTLAVLCAALNIPARLNGLSSLRNKETDRLQALSHELNQIGATNTIEHHSLILYKHGELDFSKPIQTYGDHRMAMAFSTLSSLYPSIEIKQHEVVCKSFPDFWQQLHNL